MLICEDLLLLLVAEQTRDSPRFANASAALAAAVLIDLAHNERLDVDEDGRLALIDTSLTRHSVLDDAMRRLAEESGETVEAMLAAIVTGLYVRVLDVLTERGYLAKAGDRRWRLEERSRRDTLCASLREVLIEHAEPDERTGTLIFLLSRLHVVDSVMEYSSREPVDHAEEIARGDWATNRVTRAIIEADDDWVLVGDDEGSGGPGIVEVLKDMGDGVATFFSP